MKRFILIKTNPDHFLWIEDVLKMLLGNHSHSVKDDVLCIWFTVGDDTEIIDTIRSLEEDLNTLIPCYISKYEPAEEELRLIEPVFLKVNHGYYDFKSLLYDSSLIPSAKELLAFILDKSGVTEEIVVSVAEHDLNTSKSAKALYMHRNTILYKMDRLIELKGFDLKSFKDVYILMKLIKA